MSADALPISPTAFTSALQDLPISALHLKVLELRNSIAHLDYSNEQLRPFAEGTATALSSSTTTITQSPPQQPRGEPDADCLDAIRENEQVIERMQGRIRLVRAEVERRGLSWVEFSREDDDNNDGNNNKGETTAREEESEINGVASDGARHSAWSDGTFQTGVIRPGGVVQLDNRAGQAPQGGSLTDDELRRRVEEQLRGLGGEEEEDGEEGMHL